MKASSNKAPAAGTKGPIELLVAYGHSLKLHRVNSKDKLGNAFLGKSNNHEIKRPISKLPSIKKAQTLCSNTDKNNTKPFVPLDNSGDRLAGPSKPKSLAHRIWKPYRCERDKLKPSHIPRWKSGAASSTSKANEEKADIKQFVSDTQHIQRLQVPNVTDFHQEPETTSIGPIRPIPTLGQIYRHNNIIIDGDGFYDWFMEFDAPVNSLESNVQRESGGSTDNARGAINVDVSNRGCYGGSEKSKMVFGASVFKTTDANISEWLSNDLQYSNDNESGYRSMSPYSRGTVNIESNFSDEIFKLLKSWDENYCLGSAKTSELNERNEREKASENNIGPSEKETIEPTETTVVDPPPLEKHSTVIISRLPEENVTELAITETKQDLSKNLQFPSTAGSEKDVENHVFAPSYVDCPSEILQKTTNFDGDGIEPQATRSSLVFTDLEIPEDYSSVFTLEDVDDCNLEDQSQITWCPACTSQSCITFVKSKESSDMTTQNSLCIPHGDKIEVIKAVDSDIHRDKRKYCRLCGRRNSPTQYGDVRRYCKKHSRYRQYHGNRCRITRPFDMLRKRISLTRMCKHRWNHVWKKTTARWNNSFKSHSRLGKFQMLEYLQRSLIWEDVDVQTLTLIYRETGTHTSLAEQKSASISASINQTSASTKTRAGGAVTTAKLSFKTRFKQFNLGPSRFPFFYTSKRKSMPLRTLEETKKLQRYFSYPENQNKFVEAVETMRLGTTCLCEDASQKTNANTSPINFFQFTKKEPDLALNDSTFVSPEANILSASHSTQIASGCRPSDACTQVVLALNDMETDVSLVPIFENHSVGNISNNMADYKPCGINTDSITLEFGHVSKRSAQIMTSNATSLENLKIGLAASTQPSINTASVEVSTSEQRFSENTKIDLCTETDPICLMRTEANILSISSAQMLPAAVVTSLTDVPPGGCYQASSISCQWSPVHANQVVTCTCDDTKIISTALYKVSQSTSLSKSNTEDQVVGTINSNKLSSGYAKTTSTISKNFDMKQTRDSSTQALMDQWCQPQIIIDTGPKPISLEKKATFVIIDQQCASAGTSQFKRQGIVPIQRASAATKTSFNAATQSVGPSPPVVFANKSLQKPTIDTWVQCSHILDQNDNTSHRSARCGQGRLISQPLNESMKTMVFCYDKEADPILLSPILHKSVSVMTTGPFDEASDTAGLNEGRPRVICNCFQRGRDTETNTLSDFKTAQKRECSTQNYQSQCNSTDQGSSCVGAVDLAHKSIGSADCNQRSTAEQVTTLSRLIGQPNSSQMTSDTTSTVLSSNLDAAQWIKRCIREDKGYQSVQDTEESALETLKQASLSLADFCKSPKSTKKSVILNTISKPSMLCSLNTVTFPQPPYIGSVSVDSLADVLPICSPAAEIPLPPTLPILIPPPSLPKSPPSPKNIAEYSTTDEVESKPLKESIVLQTSPDISDAATDTMIPNADYMKSTSVLTSKCVLPSPSVCSQCKGNSECVFVYDKPYCAVHKQRVEASVQMSAKHSINKEPKCREHAVDDESELTSTTSSYKPTHNSNSDVAEVLPPKVYKALYETTKMVEKNAKILSVADTEINNVRNITFGSQIPSLEGSTQTCTNCHSRVPTYLTSDLVCERLKTQLVGSCRYYSNLLTQRLERVKEKVTQPAPAADQRLYLTVPKRSHNNVCTMKPSGRGDLACQTQKSHVSNKKEQSTHVISCCALSPSLTNICGGPDRNNLKSVYYMLSAIEGRIRRLKRNIPS